MGAEVELPRCEGSRHGDRCNCSSSMIPGRTGAPRTDPAPGTRLGATPARVSTSCHTAASTLRPPAPRRAVQTHRLCWRSRLLLHGGFAILAGEW